MRFQNNAIYIIIISVFIYDMFKILWTQLMEAKGLFDQLTFYKTPR